MNTIDYTEMMIAHDLIQYPFSCPHDRESRAYLRAITEQQEERLSRIRKAMKKEGDQEVRTFWVHHGRLVNHSAIHTLTINGCDEVDLSPDDMRKYLQKNMRNEDIFQEAQYLRPLSGREWRREHNESVAYFYQDHPHLASYYYGPDLSSSDPYGVYI